MEYTIQAIFEEYKRRITEIEEEVSEQLNLITELNTDLKESQAEVERLGDRLRELNIEKTRMVTNAGKKIIELRSALEKIRDVTFDSLSGGLAQSKRIAQQALEGGEENADEIRIWTDK